MKWEVFESGLRCFWSFDWGHLALILNTKPTLQVCLIFKRTVLYIPKQLLARPPTKEQQCLCYLIAGDCTWNNNLKMRIRSSPETGFLVTGCAQEMAFKCVGREMLQCYTSLHTFVLQAY